MARKPITTPRYFHGAKIIPGRVQLPWEGFDQSALRRLAHDTLGTQGVTEMAIMVGKLIHIAMNYERDRGVLGNPHKHPLKHMAVVCHNTAVAVRKAHRCLWESDHFILRYSVYPQEEINGGRRLRPWSALEPSVDIDELDGAFSLLWRISEVAKMVAEDCKALDRARKRRRPINPDYAVVVALCAIFEAKRKCKVPSTTPPPYDELTDSRRRVAPNRSAEQKHRFALFVHDFMRIADGERYEPKTLDPIQPALIRRAISGHHKSQSTRRAPRD